MMTMTAIAAQDLEVGTTVYYSVHAEPITVASVRHGVNVYDKSNMTIVRDTEDTVELVCHPEFSFLRLVH